MLSANVSAFSMRKAVGGGGGPVPYIVEMRIIGGGGSTNNWFYACGGGAAGGFANLTLTEPAANLSYRMYIGAGGAARAAGSTSTGISGGISYIFDNDSNLVATGTGGSYSSDEAYGPTYEPPQKPTSSYSGGAGTGPDGASSGVRNPANTHTNGYDGGDSTPGGNDIYDGGNYYGNYQGGGGAGHGGAGGDAGLGAWSAGAGGAGAAWHDGVMRGGGGAGHSSYRRSIGLGTAAAGGSGGGGSGGMSTYSASANGGNGSANTGGGAGGGGRSQVNPFALGGAGGSGVGIVRYQGPQRGTGGTITSSGGYTYHTFTSTGYFTTA
jgi:hypothetical protein